VPPFKPPHPTPAWGSLTTAAAYGTSKIGHECAESVGRTPRSQVKADDQSPIPLSPRPLGEPRVRAELRRSDDLMMVAHWHTVCRGLLETVERATRSSAAPGRLETGLYRSRYWIGSSGLMAVSYRKERPALAERWPRDRWAFGLGSFCLPPCNFRQVLSDIFVVPASVVHVAFASEKTFVATFARMRCYSPEQTP